MKLTRELILSRLPNERGKPIVRLPWYAEAQQAIDDPDVLALVILAVRQSGKTEFLKSEAVVHLLTARDAYIVYLSASKAQAEAIFTRKFRRPVEKLMARLGLREVVRFTRNSMECPETGGFMEVVAPNEATVPGRSVSLLIADEGRDIPDETFLTVAPSVIASKGKMLIASSAGAPRGWFYELATKPSPQMRVIRVDTNENPHASGTTIAWLKQALGMLSPSQMQRDLENIFAETADLFLPTAVIDTCVDPALTEIPADEAVAFGMYDLSTRRDLTSRVIVLRRPTRRTDARDHLDVASIRVWDPQQSPTGEVSFEEVRADLLTLPTRFPGLRRVLIDEGHEAGALLQWARGQASLTGRVEGIRLTMDRNMELWSALRSRLYGQTLSLPRHPRLLAELKNLRQETVSNTAWRIVDASKKLHRDVSVSLAGACFAAQQHPINEGMWFYRGGVLIGGIGDQLPEAAAAASASEEDLALEHALATPPCDRSPEEWERVRAQRLVVVDPAMQRGLEQFGCFFPEDR